MNPEIEFRTLALGSPEPLDRTMAGSVPGLDAPLELGTVDTTDEARELPVRVFWCRVCAMNDATEVRNLRVWLDGAGDIPGNLEWYLDIAAEWRPDATAVQVMNGAPGAAPLTEASAVVVPPIEGGEVFTGSGHDDTSCYIYLSGRVGINVPEGNFAGVTARVSCDWC